MKKNVLFIVITVLLGMIITACASKREMFNAVSFQSATAPATADTVKTVIMPAETPIVTEQLVVTVPTEEPPAVQKEITTITEEDIARFEKELSVIMGNDYVSSDNTATQYQQNIAVDNASAKFYVITGVFSSADKALAHKAELQADGNKSGIIDSDMGMFRVYAFAGNNRATALKELSIIRDFYPEAWLFVKK